MRVACLMMQKNENFLLQHWIKYHASIFGYENLYIYDNNSEHKNVIRILDSAKASGVNVNFKYNSKNDFESKGKILGEESKRIKENYDMIMFLDCDEFIAIEDSHGQIRCDPKSIHFELERLPHTGNPLGIRGSYCNIPNKHDEFFFWEEKKIFFWSDEFQEIDMGFHTGKTATSAEPIRTKLIHIHYQHKPYNELIIAAKEKLMLRVDDFSEHTLRAYNGPGAHLVKYFLMNEKQYYESFEKMNKKIINTIKSRFGLLGLTPPFCNEPNKASMSVDLSEKARTKWINQLYDVVLPVASAFADGRLSTSIPTFTVNKNKQEYAKLVSPLECVARTLCGIGPWLSIDRENVRENEIKRKNIKNLFIAGFEREAKIKDQLYFGTDIEQPLCDTAYLCLGLMGSNNANSLYASLSLTAREYIISQSKKTLRQSPFNNNWLLFPAIIECFLSMNDKVLDGKYTRTAIEFFKRHYAGDGFYCDGPSLCVDYYNSYSIHPLLYEITTTAPLFISEYPTQKFKSEHKNRLLRYCELLERLASTNGEFPRIGRSISYRCGALYAIGYALLNETIDIEKTKRYRALFESSISFYFKNHMNFENGWLVPGVSGYQPHLCEDYITTGSLYMACLSFLPLGLPSGNPFWSHVLITDRQVDKKRQGREEIDICLERRNHS